MRKFIIHNSYPPRGTIISQFTICAGDYPAYRDAVHRLPDHLADRFLVEQIRDLHPLQPAWRAAVRALYQHRRTQSGYQLFRPQTMRRDAGVVSYAEQDGDHPADCHRELSWPEILLVSGKK